MLGGVAAAGLLGGRGDGSGSSDAVQGVTSGSMSRAALASISASLTSIPLDSPSLTLSSFATLVERTASRIRASRPFVLDTGPGPGQQFETPGVRLAFVTNADAFGVDAVFNGVVLGVATELAPAPYTASVLVNGRRVGTIVSTATTGPDAQTLTIANLGTNPKMVEIVWPYLRPMDMIGLRVSPAADIQAAPSPFKRLVCGGDSITQGQSATAPERIWSVLLTQALNGWLVNEGFSSRQAAAADGRRDGSLLPKAGIYLAFYNDYANSQRTPAQSGVELEGYLKGWFEAAPADAHLFAVSPIFASREQDRNALGFALDDYRQEFARRCSAFGSARLHHVDGLTVMTNAASRLADGVHPNDTGSAEIAARLQPVIAPYF